MPYLRRQQQKQEKKKKKCTPGFHCRRTHGHFRCRNERCVAARTSGDHVNHPLSLEFWEFIKYHGFFRKYYSVFRSDPPIIT
ncbi:hypothetical protein L873DRAFT_546067 [Choiromyces venosus 120613-1]|uniref:Uncharacterized protein n=1 Tax=Choiromyces venosus 120613-1 TaxID=1336337 RepID=A0A3N4KIX9_9PEZI|nr:hypothetical protein L873DRAFT_546067 [Choiromyces venosus 120613-1]